MRYEKLVAIILGIVTNSWSTALGAQGFMSFQSNGPGGTTVKTGDAGSYMRAGLDWDHAASHVVAGIAVPTVISPADITTWRDGSALHFNFSIPDQTTTNSNGPSSTLACGEQVIIQIDKANTKSATLAATGFFRYEVVITDATAAGVHLSKRVPEDLGAGIWDWDPNVVATTANVSTPTLSGGKWGFNVTIPLADVGNPTGDIGLALALVNDLGHSHPSGTTDIHEATGTAFPATIGLTPESEPGLTCGAGSTQKTEQATGNWVKPNTWGTGFWALSTGIVDVTFSQSPYFALSDAIRIGKCTATWSSIPAVPSLAGWDAFQQNPANNWYVFNVDKPCRMAIWFTPTVSGPAGTVVNRRFLVVFGRPGIAPQEWYVAGVTSEVAVSGSTTPVSFIWDRPTAIPFTNHPCFKIYALRAGTTSADSSSLLTITTQTQLDAAETAHSASVSNLRAAQMNFANINTIVKECSDALCQPLAGRSPDPTGAESPRVALASITHLPRLLTVLQDSTRRNRPTVAQGEHVPPRDTIGKSVRIIALGFGVADPIGHRPYVYLEPIGELGWAIPAQEYANTSTRLTFEMNNPRVVETGFVRGTRVDIPAPPRRILVALVTDVPTGIPAPRLDASALDEFANRLVQPGEKTATQIIIRSTHPAWWRWLLLIVAVLVLIALVLRFIRSRVTP